MLFLALCVLRLIEEGCFRAAAPKTVLDSIYKRVFPWPDWPCQGNPLSGGLPPGGASADILLSFPRNRSRTRRSTRKSTPYTELEQKARWAVTLSDAVLCACEQEVTAAL